MSFPLSGLRILVAEDISLIATMICDTIELYGGRAVGPFPTNADCIAALESEQVDAAILDVRLADGQVFPVAQKLRQGGIPFLFLSGYGNEMLPAEFARERHYIKPHSVLDVCANLASLLQDGGSRSLSSNVVGSP